MTIQVPQSFAESMRGTRLVILSLLAIASFALAMFADQKFQYVGYPLMVYIGVIGATYRLPLLYRLTPRAIYLTTPIELLSIPLSLAINFWVAWPFDRVSDIRHTHYNESPALLIRTRLNPRGFLLPVLRTDAQSVVDFLRPDEAGTGANAFS